MYDNFLRASLNLLYFVFVAAYRTVAGVNGPLVILDQVKVSRSTH